MSLTNLEKVTEVAEVTRLERRKVALGGFSQGGHMALQAVYGHVGFYFQLLLQQQVFSSCRVSMWGLVLPSRHSCAVAQVFWTTFPIQTLLSSCPQVTPVLVP